MSYSCPKCRNEFEKGTKFCNVCGYNLESEYIENPICPKCRTSYPTNTKFCVNDGSRLVRQEDLVPKCIICNTSYPDDIKFCPIDGGEVKIILDRQMNQPTYGQNQFGASQKYPKASLGNRFIAALLDGLILMGLCIPTFLFFVIGLVKMEDRYNRDIGVIFLIIAFLFYFIPVFYSFIKDGLGQGQSWGKKAIDLMVVNLDNDMPCSKGKSFFRNLISGLIGAIPFIGWLIEPIMVIATSDGRKLGDRAANTQVIDKKYFKNKI